MSGYATQRYEREAVSIGPEAHVVDVADAMDEHSVGSVVVVDDAGRPIGIVTDRDLVRRVVAAGRDPGKTTARDVMTRDPVTISRGEPLSSLIEKARVHRIRRLPVVDGGRLVSLISLDDVLLDVSSTFFNLAETTRIELREAARTARGRRRHEAREDALEEVQTRLTSLGHELGARLKEELARVLPRSGGGSRS
jgi:CBS domain-containing protein